LTEKTDNAELLFPYLNEVMILAQLVTNTFERLVPEGMTMAQFGVLNHLCRLGISQAPTEIARVMQVRKSTMTSTLGTLLRAGYIVIGPNQKDGRAKIVSVTAKGREARATAIDRLKPELMAISALLPEGMLASSMQQLRRLRKLMDERRDALV